jgi:hypothetical protein
MLFLDLLVASYLALLATASPLKGLHRAAAAANENAPQKRRGVAYNNPDFASYFCSRLSDPLVLQLVLDDGGDGNRPRVYPDALEYALNLH